jgi:hypothetical protein
MVIRPANSGGDARLPSAEADHAGQEKPGRARPGPSAERGLGPLGCAMITKSCRHGVEDSIECRPANRSKARLPR